MNSPYLKRLSFVQHPDKKKLIISSLPSRQQLEDMPVPYWINVAGVDIHQVYPKLAIPNGAVAQFEFADVFSNGELLTNLKPIHADLYLSVSDTKHHHALLASVIALIEQFKNTVPTGIFCHRGLARSPLVAAAALNYYYQEPIAVSIQRVRHIHPPAYFTDISLSALFWLKEELHQLPK